MDQIKFSCRIDTTDPACPLGLEIWLDDLQIFDQDHVQASVAFEHQFADQEAQHQLRFILKNKPGDFTQVDASGVIMRDALLRITDMAFDEIGLGHMITEQAIYTHDFNGTAEELQDKFYGDLGCNGTVSLEFSTPIYLWVLEHM